MHQRSKEGYLIIDNRESPGVPQILTPSGPQAAPFVPQSQVMEMATVTCAHCNRVVVLNPERTRPRGFCVKCNHYICDEPGCGLECRPFKQFIDDYLEAASKGLPLPTLD